MPKQKIKLTQKEQRSRFEAEVARMVADGELSPTDAEKAMDKLLGSQRIKSPEVD